MSGSLAGTGHWIACARAAETLRPDSLFEDPIAVEFLRQTASSVYGELRSTPSSRFDVLALRTKFFDDYMTGSAADGLRQVVILAAGMDSRAFRISWPEDTVLYELDLPEAVDEKSAFLDRGGFISGCRRVPVGADLTGDWTVALLQAGFVPDRPTAWLVEGVLYYLTGTDAEAVVDGATKLSAPGSSLGLEYVNTDLYQAPWMRDWLEQMRRDQRPWLSGVAEPEKWLERWGWRAEVCEPCDMPEARGRRVPQTPPRDTPGAARTWLVTGHLAPAVPADRA